MTEGSIKTIEIINDYKFHGRNREVPKRALMRRTTPPVIVKVPDQVLRETAKNVSSIDQGVKTLIDEMINALQSQEAPEGVGLAAPQIGVSKRIFVAKVGKHIVTFINPRIVSLSEEKEELLEGCLSLPKYYGTLKRATSVTIEGLSLAGKKIRRTYKGFSARIMQHEMDHLDGILYVDHVLSQKGKMFEVQGEELREVKL